MGKLPHESGAARELAADDPTVELDILEQTISIDGARALRDDEHGLIPAPIPQAWILAGNPTARSKRLAGSSDQLAMTLMRDCTAGLFNWSYDDDEVVHVLEGGAIVEDAAGVRQRLQPGDTLLFRAGSRHQWTIPNYIRQIAFIHSPLSRELMLISGTLMRLKALFRRKPAGATAHGR